jgi:hypothetical protein
MRLGRVSERGPPVVGAAGLTLDLTLGQPQSHTGYLAVSGLGPLLTSPGIPLTPE